MPCGSVKRTVKSCLRIHNVRRGHPISRLQRYSDLTIGDCKLIETPVFTDARGSVTFAEVETHIDFAIKRNFILFNLTPSEERGHHAHKITWQLITCMHGNFYVDLFDGKHRQTFYMSRPNQSLLISPMVWNILGSFSSDAVCSVLASEKYDEADYIRDMDDFLSLVGSQ